MFCFIFNDIIEFTRQVQKFMDYFCLTTFSFNYFEGCLALSFWFFLVECNLLPLIFKLFKTLKFKNEKP